MVASKLRDGELRETVEHVRAKSEELSRLITQISAQLEQVPTHLLHVSAQLEHLPSQLQHLSMQVSDVASRLDATQESARLGFTATQLSMLNPQLRRNILPNSDAASHKLLMATWQATNSELIGYEELLNSGFRVFSQNDEDGIILRMFSHLGTTNKFVVEIGSNCDGSDIDIPENLSSNLIVNHGWHGAIFEIDQLSCDKMRYFFARNLSTKHFHLASGGIDGFFSPEIVNSEITAENINDMLLLSHSETQPDLLIVDIDGGDYAIVKNMTNRPRVLVVEFEKRFRDRHSVVQFERNHFGQKFAQSGACSLPAWEKLLGGKGYTLCAIGSCGFNAFFVRSDIAEGKFKTLSVGSAFDRHPVLSKAPEEMWLSPDETWEAV
ncbi:hypothetical protein LAV84_22615 [Rhizobium sp. VS19-DR104.2]|uniref:hypothetical protein n=1 Tax=unclassified Rhizobium TaxID=2613769 RepID=UPI001CC74B61|nr:MULTISPECIES: hypothetical protein [unclassified Rhizobium]MBZ5761969.1 hypothetical protein [Rhizobium sp. VS19-DR96]MBZ5768385.1 hypothetical protein [Rhizobium sp. VS19-DR129.2]MBZ5775655.1 hypothetical protein [Rhizobium sp. VS19-DRK62.2]MBZ5786847.1 hypothetical protein [Rhizobium sp. VS19-DR121]MBZ5804417.1 hypothetical protein [Rhizobium sp. VS19-DR181]